MHTRIVCRTVCVVAGLAFCVSLGGNQFPTIEFIGAAQADEAAAEKAFNSAKELGTLEAWQAFLANYPTGFHADLARAYVKKLEDGKPAALTTSSDVKEYPTPAGSWGGIVRAGEGQLYQQVDSLPEGAPVTLMGRAEVSENGYPWFKIWYGPQGEKKGFMWGGILCSTGAERADLYKTCSAKAAAPAVAPPVVAKPVARPVAPPLRCAAGYIAINGRCIIKQNAAAHCGPGFHAQGGTCVPGYVAPKQLSTEQVKGVARGCPKGQVWSKAEGCHEDD